MMGQHEPIRLVPSMIPTSPNFDVKDSDFFKKWSQLPSPEEVRAQVKAQYVAGVTLDSRKRFSPTGPHIRPPLALFENKGLLVKWGSDMNLLEAHTLYAVGRLLGGSVPVPQVYGWRLDGDVTYIYMEYIQGQTLERLWDSLETEECVSICRALRTAYDSLRQLEQDPSDAFVGSITRTSIYDRAIDSQYMSEAGPFTTVREFHDWFTFLHRRPMPDPYSVPVEPFRQDLPDDSDIKFTHGDLHRSNIIVTSRKPYRVLAIVDWEQSGWFPAYWEARKARYSADGLEPWAEIYLPMILDQYSSTLYPWDYYTGAMGC